MNKQFTPGPWVASSKEPEQNQHGAYGIDIDTPSQNINSVATVWQSPGGFTQEDYANVNLIAAAPEMFKLLEKFCEACDMYNIEELAPEHEQAKILLDRITQH